MADPINSIVTVNITATAATPTLPTTNIPAFITYHTHFTDKIRTYSQPADMVTDGFTTTEPAYLLALAICRQNPRPAQFKAIRGTTSVQQTFTFLVTDNTNGDSVGLTVTSPAGAATTMYVTVASQTLAQVATAIAALVPAGVTAATGGTATVTFTVTASGNLWYPSEVKGGNYTDTTVTAAPGPDLDAALLVDPNFYSISGSWMDATNIGLIATWAQSNKRFHAYTTADNANMGSAPSGPMGTAKTASQSYSFGQYCGLTPVLKSTPAQYGGTAAAAMLLVRPAGSFALFAKTELGTAIDSLTTTQQNNITANNGNFLISSAGLNILFDGRMADGGWADIRIGLDALSRQIQLQVFGLLANSPKVGYDRAGLSQVKAEVLSAIKSFIPTRFISNDAGFEPLVTVPDITTVAPADKTARILRNVNFTCLAVGAVQSVVVNGTVNF